MLILNAKVIACDSKFSIAEAIAIEGDQITAVGSTSEITNKFKTSEILDAKGRAIIPGMIDGHAHMDREGLKSTFPSLSGCRSIADIIEIIEVLVAKANPGDWIVTMPIGEPPYYFDVPTCLKEKRFPTRHDLDRVSPNNPVYIRPIWGYWRHIQPLTSIANSLALQEAGLYSDPGDLPEIIKFKTDPGGQLNGIIQEYTFMPVAELCYFKSMPRFGHNERVNGIKQAMRTYNKTGTTSVYEEHGCAQEVINAYRAVNASGNTTVRATLVYSPSWHFAQKKHYEEVFAEWADWLGGFRGNGDNWLTVSGIFADFGITPDNLLRSQSSPYTGWAGFNYDSGISKDRMLDYLVAAARHDIRVNAIWMEFLDLFEKVDKFLPLSGKRWVMGHLDCADTSQINSMAKLGLAMSSHTNRYVFKHGHNVLKDIGSERENEIAPLRSVVEAGIPISLATDNVPTTLWYPVWQAVTRYNMYIDAPVAPDQSLSREQALTCATLNGAFLTGEENFKGSLEKGKVADLAILSKDPLICPENDLKDITANLTMVGGQIVHNEGKKGIERHEN
ncbi:MAG: amidohydrolase family protein [Pseudomonadota bacterium]|nr:amidohydrolase family protein [Pseudomonadota bacterium]